jgi:hypothetical protein
MTRLSCLPVFVLFIASCHSASKPAFSLTETSMYSLDTVRMVAGSGDEKAAGKKIQEAVGLFKKGSDTAGSVALFKSAVWLDPTAKSYFDLGGILIAAHRNDEAINALYIAEKLNYTPLANVMARYALAYSNRDTAHNENGEKVPSERALHYMELAIEMGYAHPRDFLQQTMFPNLSGSPLFDATYVAAVGGGPGINSDKGLWESFSGQFSDLPLPLVIDRKWIQAHGHGADISTQYEKYIPEMRNVRFAREESYNYYYVGLVHRDAHYIALIYCSTMDGAEGESSLVYNLVSYDHHGKIIDMLPVAGREDVAKNFMTFSIQPNLRFQVQEFAVIYKEKPEDAGYGADNISGETPFDPKQYHIATSGKFELTGAPLAAR